MAAYYDDPLFSYEEYWHGRQYEHLSEVMAIKRLLGTKIFENAADVGGGFGRLTSIIAKQASHTYLIEPSAKQRLRAQKKLQHFSSVKYLPGTSSKIPLPNNFLDLVIIVRVLHHLPSLNASLTELCRVTKPGASVIIEFANSTNFKARLISFLTSQPIKISPQEKRSPENINKKTIPFVNHHPQLVLSSLKSHGFMPLHTISVSNIRSPRLKKILPLKLLLILEWFAQTALAKLNFGPSIFVLARRA